MKRMKKLVSFLLAAVMVMAMSVTAFAEGTTYKITINDATDGHTYEAYQIFTGELQDKDGEKVLSNVKWGSGQTTHAAGTDATAAAEGLADGTTDVKTFIKGLTLGTAIKETGTKTANNTYVLDGLVPGYYLVKDKAGSVTGTGDAYTDFIIQVVGDAEASAKRAYPTVDKEVEDEEGWGETADHAINESFRFKLTAAIPNDSDMDAYTSYKLVFNDTMSAGVTFESIESVTIDGKTIENYNCTANNGDAGTTWTLTIEDLCAVDGITTGADLKGKAVVVIYNAHLNESAVIGSAAQAGENNKNTVYLQYSNNPNADGLGSTESDNVWVFTYKMDNKKVDGSDNNAALAGAGFKLYDSTDAEVSLFYDTVKNIYRPAKSGETAAEMMVSDEDGLFNIVGLDAGTYTLKETQTPPGYNTCKDVTIVISATHSENPDGEGAEATITMTQDGAASTMNEIVNKKGSTLPSTGGIGTTIFYVCGGFLVVFAAVVLITKRRMKSER